MLAMFRFVEDRQGRPTLTTSLWIVLVQFAATLAGAAISMLVDPGVALSVLLGGLVSAIPACYSAVRLSRRTADPNLSLIDMMMAEFGKFALTVVLLGVVFVTVENLAPLYFFGTLLGLQVTYIIVPLALRKGRAAAGRQNNESTSNQHEQI